MTGKYLKKIISILVLSGLIAGSGGCGAKSQVDPIDNDNRVFYEIFVGSFSDSDGNGTGDIRGIINRLDYLNDGNINSGESLGVQGLWLTPVFSSPSYHKYDVTDYYTIDKKFGTEDDLKELCELCEERNVKVIIDLVLNHTSSDNSWFSKFKDAHKNGYTDSEYYDFYTWAKKEDLPGGRVFRQIPGCTDEYYECNFSGDMPELNYDNEAVRQAVLDIAKYWLDAGVDGFRFDAVKYVYYGETKKSAEFWKWYVDELRKYKEDVYCVGECWSGDSETLEYISGVNCFNFQMSGPEGFTALAAKGLGSIESFTKYVEQYQNKVLDKNPEFGMPVSFLSNHDMDRAAGYMMVSNRWANMAANLYILSPGSPFIYYGEEIGMKGTRGAANTDANRRLAMLWGDDDKVKDPNGTTFDSSKQTNGTVKDQLEKEDSLLNYYKKLISLRVKYPEIGSGRYSAVVTSEKTVGGFKIEGAERTIWLFHNTGDSEKSVNLSEALKADASKVPTEILDFVGQSTNLKVEGKNGEWYLTVGPQTSVILK